MEYRATVPHGEVILMHGDTYREEFRVMYSKDAPAWVVLWHFPSGAHRVLATFEKEEFIEAIGAFTGRVNTEIVTDELHKQQVIAKLEKGGSR